MYGKMQECGLFAITSLIMGSHGVSDHGESACNVGDRVWSLGWKDSLEKGMAPHFSIFTWKILWVEEPGGLQVHGTAKSWTWLTNNLVITAIVLLGLSRNNMLFFSEKRKLTWLFTDVAFIGRNIVFLFTLFVSDFPAQWIVMQILLSEAELIFN